MTRSPDVDAYLERSERWHDEMAELREILLRCGLDEAIKWRSPCYSSGGKNIVIIQEMTAFLSLMFFKGALLDDTDGVLREQGPNSRSALRMEFTSVDGVQATAGAISRYVAQAVAVEEAGLEVEAPSELTLVEELQNRLDADPVLKAAFEALTPGRQRHYHLYISEAKKAETREARIDKHVDRILEGKGLRDR